MADHKCSSRTSAQLNKMRPANPQQAQQHMRHLLGKKITGRRGTRVREHTKRALTIAEVLYRKFQVGPYQYKLKHLLWYIEIYKKDLATNTRYRHWLTIRIIVSALDKQEEWSVLLHGARWGF